MPVIDSQVHAYEADTPARPWLAQRNWPAHVTGDEMVEAMDAVGVDGAILVAPYSLYGFDASYSVDVRNAHPDRFALVRPLDPTNPDVEAVIVDWKATAGAVGVRLMLGNYTDHGADYEGFDRVLRGASRHGFPVNIHCWGQLDVAMRLADRHANTMCVIDHLGLMQTVAPPPPDEPFADLPRVLELAKRPNVVIKISGACALSHAGYPFPDIWGPLARIFDAWGFERCLWGTDWTRTAVFFPYEHAVAPFRLSERLSDSDREMLMGGACARTYGWAPPNS